MGAPSVPDAMSAEEMLGMQRATAEAQLELEDQRMENMLDVEQQRTDMEQAEKERLKQQGVAEEAALAALENYVSEAESKLRAKEHKTSGKADA